MLPPCWELTCRFENTHASIAVLAWLQVELTCRFDSFMGCDEQWKSQDEDETKRSVRVRPLLCADQYMG